MTVPAIQQTVSGSATSASSYTLASWTPAAGEFVLIWIATRQTVGVSSVSGNGLTWTQVFARQDQQNQCNLACYKGIGASPSTGQITVTLSGTGVASIALAHRISGADTTTPVQSSASADTGATDTNTPSVDSTTTGTDVLVVGGCTHRTQTFTVGTGETAISINNTVGSAGDTTALSTEYQSVASASTVTINGTLGSAIDWVIGAVAVQPPQTVTGTLTKTQASQTASSDGTVAIAGAVTKTQAGQTSSATGVVAIVGAAAVTQAAQSVTAAGAVAIAGALTKTQAAQTLAATGSQTVYTGVLTATQAAQTVSAAGTLPIVGALAKTQAAQTVAGAGTLPIVGALTKTQSAQTLRGGDITFRPSVGNTFTAPPAVVHPYASDGRDFALSAAAQTARARGSRVFEAR
jgi:hypothetical protein